MTQPTPAPDILGAEPAGGFAGDAEGAWAGEPGAVLGGGGQIASRGAGDLDPLHGQPGVPVTDITGAMGPKLYQFDAAGNRTTAVAGPGE